MEVKALKSKVDEHDDSLRSLESSNCDLKEEQDKEELYRLNYEMKEEILDIKTRSMRDNLLFGGISRVLRTNEPGREFEDTESVLKDFIVKEMDIHEQTSFERVHRLGKPRNGKPPFIVAKFSSHKQPSEFITEVKNNSLQDLITLIDNPQDLSSIYVLNTIVDNIGTIFVNSAKSVFGKSKVTFKGNNSKFKSWFGRNVLLNGKTFMKHGNYSTETKYSE
ncbi:hypothetical protein KUTeg_014356 [Tegillarca granosa]|uniref:Uncharacterized protein n=1 Tax=Tegillarca granosa TaxID=220873 RepID=A0ABQ9EZT9_TEGGR|nr:hypothetical protein KUTeg_014356 [Tegillarca granosa]